MSLTSDMSSINNEIDTKFQELLAQISSETTLDEYINFDTETITSDLTVAPTHVDSQQECQEEIIAEAF